MPRKSKSKVEAHSSRKTHSVANLNPTTNHKLHLDLWKQLLHRLEEGRQSNSAKSASSDDHVLNSVSENISDERMFGKEMRRLLNVVVRAILNPGELKKESKGIMA